MYYTVYTSVVHSLKWWRGGFVTKQLIFLFCICNCISVLVFVISYSLLFSFESDIVFWLWRGGFVTQEAAGLPVLCLVLARTRSQLLEREEDDHLVAFKTGDGYWPISNKHTDKWWNITDWQYNLSILLVSCLKNNLEEASEVKLHQVYFYKAICTKTQISCLWSWRRPVGGELFDGKGQSDIDVHPTEAAMIWFGF